MGRKRFPIVDVTWIDANGGDEGWMSLDKASRKPQTIRSVGILLSDNDEGVTLILSHNPKCKQFAADIFIPHCNIIEREVVK